MIYTDFQHILFFEDPYDVIVADPPWSFSNANLKRACGRREKADYHYKDKMTNAEIKALPIGDIAAKTSALVLWSTGAHADFAIECLKHWGFKYATDIFVWAKQKNGKFVKNVGPWTMKSCETAYLGTRGTAHRDLLVTQSECQLIVSERGKHSEKPKESFDRLERMFPNTRKIDLFARKTRPGWDVFGNEVEV